MTYRNRVTVDAPFADTLGRPERQAATSIKYKPPAFSRPRPARPVAVSCVRHSPGSLFLQTQSYLIRLSFPRPELREFPRA